MMLWGYGDEGGAQDTLVANRRLMQCKRKGSRCTTHGDEWPPFLKEDFIDTGFYLIYFSSASFLKSQLYFTA